MKKTKKTGGRAKKSKKREKRKELKKEIKPEITQEISEELKKEIKPKIIEEVSEELKEDNIRPKKVRETKKKLKEEKIKPGIIYADEKLSEETKPETIENISREQKKIYIGTILKNKVLIFNKSGAEEVYDLGCFGKIIDDKNELSLEESLLLMKRNRLKVFKDEQELDGEEFYKYACSLDEEFPWKYTVYEDLRNRGLLVRTGFKFGTHFRVYSRGVKLKRGPKTLREHTKWIVHAIPENYTCSFPELSRAVRLAHNIRAKMLWSLVDEEGDVTYYEIMRKTP